jgi:tRNA pseudouridine38-40 synthase
MRIAIGVAYCGESYEGWQTQPSGKTVQDHLQRALSGIADAKVSLAAAGRTDSGVHASGQVAHFDVAAERPESAWVRGANTLLPPAIAVQWARRVPDDFHARYSALARSYVYVLYRHPVRPALFHGRVGWFAQPLDVEAMQRAARLLLGQHDFSAFRSSECQAKTATRDLRIAQVDASGEFILFRFTANGFLHHMVRNIVGSLVYVGKGSHSPEWMTELLDARDRRHAAPTFSAEGLYLTRVEYGSQWLLPAFPRTMPFNIQD